MSWLHDFGLSAESLLYVFLPALLFDAALNVDVRQLSDEVAPVLLLAVIGVIVCTFVVGLALWPISPVGILACVILGAIIATTDPVAVVGIFHDIGAPRRLSTLVQGESLFNDAAAIAIYSLTVAMLAGNRPANPVDGLVTFVRQFGGGLAAGYVAGWAVTLFLPNLRASRLAEATLTIAFAYVIFVLCDHYLGVSGVVAVAAAALAFSAGGRRRLAPSNWESLVVTWEQLAFWASSLIFLFAAMQTPELLEKASWSDLGLLAALVVAALVARALTLYGLIPMLSFAGIAKPIDRDHKLVMLWGGMRGAVSLALALAAAENTALPPEVRQFVGILATGFVLFTLLVTAPTMRPLMRLLKISSLAPAEVAVSQRVIGLSLHLFPRKSRRSDASIRSRPRSSPRWRKSMTATAATPPKLRSRMPNFPPSCGSGQRSTFWPIASRNSVSTISRTGQYRGEWRPAFSLMPRGSETERTVTGSPVTRRRRAGSLPSTGPCGCPARSITGSALRSLSRGCSGTGSRSSWRLVSFCRT